VSLRPPGQPFTFGGLARYAHATPARLLGMALLFGLLSGATIATLFVWRWAAVLTESISKLPENSRIQGGVLVWPDKNLQLLGANAFVSIAVAEDDLPSAAPVDFAFVFEPRHLSLASLTGTFSVPYPQDWTIELNRPGLLPLWGAWEKAAGLILMVAAGLGVILSWFVLAFGYAFFVRALAGIMRRELVLRQAWKLCVAAQWPGAVLMSFAIALYALGETTLLLVGCAFVAHFGLTFVYLLFAPICLPPRNSNPFSSATKRSKGRKNPFQSSTE
jgi:hypothetical protein